MKFLPLAFLFVLCNSAFALNQDEANEALAKEFASCAGYHMTRMAMMENAGQSEEAMKSVAPVFQKTVEAGSKLKPKETIGKWALATMSENVKIIEEKGQEGVGIVMLKYSGKCKAALADPDGRMKYWLDQK